MKLEKYDTASFLGLVFSQILACSGWCDGEGDVKLETIINKLRR